MTTQIATTNPLEPTVVLAAPSPSQVSNVRVLENHKKPAGVVIRDPADEDDPSVWMDPSQEIIVNLCSSQKGGVTLEFEGAGYGATITVKIGKCAVGFLGGSELAIFVSHALARSALFTPKQELDVELFPPDRVLDLSLIGGEELDAYIAVELARQRTKTAVA